jgi:hypothetical protein
MDKFEVRNEAVEKMLKEVGEILSEVCPKGYGFSLMIFKFGDGGNMFYTSNARREDMVLALQEFISKYGEN